MYRKLEVNREKVLFNILGLPFLTQNFLEGK